MQNGDQNSIDSVVKSYQKVFSSQDAGIKGFEAKVKIKANVSPVFEKSRPVPYALKGDIEKEYDCLIDSIPIMQAHPMVTLWFEYSGMVLTLDATWLWDTFL